MNAEGEMHVAVDGVGVRGKYLKLSGKEVGRLRKEERGKETHETAGREKK